MLAVNLSLFFIPKLEIQEGHNYFTYIKKGEILEKSLPPEIFDFMKHLLRKQYPVKRECYDKDYCWGKKEKDYQYKEFPGPIDSFAFSGDGIWQHPKYSRVIDNISFHNQNGLRPDFLNTNRVNWIDWYSDTQRRSIIPRQNVPFFVMYEFPKEAIGGKLLWKGYIILETEKGKFKYLENSANETEAIILTDQDVGKRIFGVSILWDKPLSMRFIPPQKIKIASIFSVILKFIGVLTILYLLTNISFNEIKKWKRTALLIAGAAIISLVMIFSRGSHFLIFRTHRTGSDGLTYISYARDMLRHLLNGDIALFLRGGQDVFYFMPGMSYFRAIEKIIFGDTNYLYITFFLIFILYVWKFIRYFLPFQVCILLFLIFIGTNWLQPFGLTFEFYFKGMLDGFPSVIAYTFLLMGLIGIISNFNGKKDFRWFGFWSGLSFATAIFMRPNIALIIGIFLLLTGVKLLKSKRLIDLAAISVGFSTVLLIPFHNWYFGDKIVLLTSSAFIPTNYISSPSIYLTAIKDLLTFNVSAPAVLHALEHITLWLEGRTFFMHVTSNVNSKAKILMHALALLPVIFIAISKKYYINSKSIWILSVSALSQHLTLLFWHPAYRYSAIVWFITFIIALTFFFEKVGKIYKKITVKKITESTELEDKIINSAMPLVVGLNGTLIKTNLLFESLLKLIKIKPFFIFIVPFWVFKQTAYLKSEIAKLVLLDVNLLPYRNSLIDFLIQKKKEGRKLVLATSSDYNYAEQIANRLDIFDEFFICNSRTSNKANMLKKKYGAKGFDYIGGNKKDIVILSIANSGIFLSHNKRLLKKANNICRLDNSALTIENKKINHYLNSLRIHQWVKNALIFAPLFLAHKYYDYTLDIRIILAFVSFCLCASSGYLLNDLFDLDNDRQHKVKSKRPVASGEISIQYSIIMIFVLLLSSIIIGSLISAGFIYILLLYYLSSAFYSIYLKRIALIDTLTLSCLYTLRIAAGIYVCRLTPSFWLLCFSIFLFFSLAILKRFTELYSLKRDNKFIIVGRGYNTNDLDFLRSAGLAAGYLSALIIALYINSEASLIAYSSPFLLWILSPLLLHWITSLWFKAHQGLMDDDPIKFALSDKTSLIFALLFFIIILLARHIR